MLFDASKGWNTYQRLILPIEKVIDGKEYVSIDFIAPPTWGKDEPYVEHTLDIPFGNINTPEASPVGGIVGRTATSTKITACASNAEITGYSSVGGIAGSFSANDTINDCHATGKLVL